MQNFLLKYKKFICSVLLICFIGFLGIFVFKVNNAYAGFIDLSFEVIASIIAKIGEIIRLIASLTFWLASMLLEIAFGLEGFTNAGIVKTGWRLTRDLVNMFFVLVLLAIAFGTILRRETYGMKQVLPKLIIVALLINFSLVICGAIIDFSQVATRFFYDEMIDQGISAYLADAIKIQKVFEIDDTANTAQQITAGVSGIIMVIFSIGLGILFILAATIAIALGAFFLISRLIILWILLILAPLAWFAWILPGTVKYAIQWWNTFLSWTFFAPIYAFFVWLAIHAAQGGDFQNIIQQEVNNIVTSSGWSTIGIALASSPRLFLQFLCIIGILIGGLLVASKMGAYGAKGAISLAKSGGNMAVKGASKWAGTKALGLAQKKIPKKAQRFIAKIPGASKFTEPVSVASEERKRARVKDAEKKIGDYTDENLMRMNKTASPEQQIAIAKILSKRGPLKENKEFDYTKDEIIKTLKIAKQYGMHKDILKSKPELSKEVGESIEKIIADIAKTKEGMNKISTKSLENESVINAVKTQLTTKNGILGGKELSGMAKNNFEAFSKIKEEILDTIEYQSEDWKKLEKERPDIAKYIESGPYKAMFKEYDKIRKTKKEKPEKKEK